MHSFSAKTKDGKDRTWLIEVNVTSIKRVRSVLDVDLLQVFDGKLIDRLARDPILLCNVLYVLCEPQAVKDGVTEDAFGESMAGDAIEAATTALMDELISFCPSPRDRKNLGQATVAARRAMDRARDVVEAKLNSGDLERQVDKELALLSPSASGGPSGSAPESSG